MNRFDSSDIVINDIYPIQYHRDAIHPIEFTGERFLISMGLDPELLLSKKKFYYGSPKSLIYCLLI